MDAARYVKGFDALVVKTNHFNKLGASLKKLAKTTEEAKSECRGICIISDGAASDYLKMILNWHLRPKIIKWFSFKSAFVSNFTLAALPIHTDTIFLNNVRSNIEVLSGLNDQNNISLISLSKMTSISGGALNYLRPSSRIEKISLRSSPLDRKLRNYSPSCELLSNFSGLTEVSINDCNLIDKDIYHLRECHSLKNLDLENSPGIRNGIYHIIGMRELERLDLSNCGLGANDFRGFSKTPKLKELNVKKNPNLGRRSLWDISEIRTLQTLKLSGLKIDSTSLRFLLNNSNLKELHLLACELPDKFGELISTSCLETLKICYSDFETSSFSGLLDCLTLKSLDLRETPATKYQGEAFNDFLANAEHIAVSY